VFWFFRYKSELQLKARHFSFNFPSSKKFLNSALSLFQDKALAILAIILNHPLYTSYGGEHSIAVYGIISRMLMSLFPVLELHKDLFPLQAIITVLINLKESKKQLKFDQICCTPYGYNFLYLY
jgi:hypothetical protein